MRRENDPFSARPLLQAIIDIVKIDWKKNLVETANCEIVGAPRQKASRRDGTTLTRDQEQIRIAWIALQPVIESVGRAEIWAEHDTAMLHNTAWPNQ